MNDNSRLIKLGFKAGLLFLVALLIGGCIGFVTLFVLAFTKTSPAIGYGIATIIGAMAGGVLAGRYLQRNNVGNYILISLLSTTSGLLVPGVGAMIMFPVLTVLLGKSVVK